MLSQNTIIPSLVAIEPQIKEKLGEGGGGFCVTLPIFYQNSPSRIGLNSHNSGHFHNVKLIFIVSLLSPLVMFPCF